MRRRAAVVADGEKRYCSTNDGEREMCIGYRLKSGMLFGFNGEFLIVFLLKYLRFYIRGDRRKMCGCGKGCLFCYILDSKTVSLFNRCHLLEN